MIKSKGVFGSMKIARKSTDELFGIHNSIESQGAIMALVYLMYSSAAPHTWECLQLDVDEFKKNHKDSNGRTTSTPK
jgi:hypothetical protein